MATCFVMQPFDGGTFDRRYDDHIGLIRTQKSVFRYKKSKVAFASHKYASLK